MKPFNSEGNHTSKKLISYLKIFSFIHFLTFKDNEPRKSKPKNLSNPLEEHLEELGEVLTSALQLRVNWIVATFHNLISKMPLSKYNPHFCRNVMKLYEKKVNVKWNETWFTVEFGTYQSVTAAVIKFGQQFLENKKVIYSRHRCGINLIEGKVCHKGLVYKKSSLLSK